MSTATEMPETRSYRFSPQNLEDYDSERHIKVDEALSLVKGQDLDPRKLRKSIREGSIRAYSFESETYIDRLDVGRVYHREPKRKQGLTIDRFFSQEGVNPIEAAGPFKRRHIKIYEKDDLVFEMPDAEFPESWDEASASIVAQKYFYKPHGETQKHAVREKIGNDHENSPAHLATRVSNFFADEGFKLGYFATRQDADRFRDELLTLQLERKLAFNSPVQFNAGIFNEYGIRGNGNVRFYRDPKTGQVSEITSGEYIHPQSHACFILGPNDDLESILEHTVDEGRIFSLGSGVGQNIGKLREEGGKLSGGGKASGPMSFWKVYDRAAGSIKSGGKSRRAARMTIMDSNHPDILYFIEGKVDEDHKALVLMQNGWSLGMNGKAAETVAFQNTNQSVRMTDADFEAIKNDEEIRLIGVSDGKVKGTIKARELLKKIAYGSWRIGDPAVQFDGAIQRMHTAPNSGRQRASNPCSEYMYLNDTSCNLASLNVVEFADDRGNIDIPSFTAASRTAQTALDIANDASSYPVQRIAQISPEFRTTGLGYANIGNWLMISNVAYDSEEGRARVGALTALMTGTAYETSADMAKQLGTFTHFEFNKTHMLEVMKRHQKSLDDIAWEHVPEELREAATSTWERAIAKGHLHGYRNAQTTVIAPTGTISFLMGCPDSTGIEPGTSLSITKDLAGGGKLKIANSKVETALRNLGYAENEIASISKHIGENNTIIEAPHVNPRHYPIFDTAFGNAAGMGAIPFEGHVRMLAAAQPFVSGAISKTCNLPESATVKDIYDAYILGHELGLKAMAVFRNYSKPTSALSLEDRELKVLKRGEKEDLPRRRHGEEWEVEIAGTPVHVIVSEYPDGRPGQIAFFAYKTGSTVGAHLTNEGILASKALKRGLHIDDVIESWRGHVMEPNGLVAGDPHIKTALSPLDYASKVLALHYRGDVSVANEPEKVQVEKLRGSENGAFRTYERADIDEWNFEDVINDAELGGFKNGEKASRKLSELKLVSGKRNGNTRGVTCGKCGNLMDQYAPNCYKCTCGNNIGGCGI